MIRILWFFWQLCLLRAGPERLPSTNFATASVFAGYLIIAIMVYILVRPEQALLEMIGTIGIGVMLQAGVTFALLYFMGAAHRFRATWSALLGTNGLILIILLPFNFIMLYSTSNALTIFADSATWVCLGWWLAIAGYIYHRAVNISILQGSAIAFLIELMGVVLAYNLFPR